MCSGVFISSTSRGVMRALSLRRCCIAVYRRDARGLAPLLDAAGLGPVMEVMMEVQMCLGSRAGLCRVGQHLCSVVSDRLF